MVVALVTLAVVLVPAAASAHHQPYRSIGALFNGVCDDDAPEYHVELTGTVAVQAPKRRFTRIGVVWRIYRLDHPGEEPLPGEEWELVRTRTVWTQSDYIESIERTGSYEEDADHKIVATAKWIRRDGLVIRHRKLLAKYVDFYAHEPRQERIVCYGFEY
jgi:hypothetical protein